MAEKFVTPESLTGLVNKINTKANKVILNGVEAEAVNGTITLTVPTSTVYIGSEEPASTLGENGDVYIKTS